jgi:pimeloyl-ACP methyl ester carboxylesterase
MQTKPSIVFVHGIWADGSCFSKVIPTLQADGYEVMASQHSLDTLEGDVATVTRTLGRVSAPAILVGHSYGGTVITAAGTDERVAGLVYIAALAPDGGETSQSQQNQFPVTDVFSHIEITASLVLKAFDTLFNKRDYAAVEKLWSPHYIQHRAHIGPGRDGLFNLVKTLPPTLRYEPGTIVADGDFVIVHGRFQGFSR